MSNKVVRISILAMLVVVLALAGVGAKAAQLDTASQSVVFGPCGTPPTPPWTCGDIYSVTWNGSTDPNTWDKTGLYTLTFSTSAQTFGELKAAYESKLGYPVVLLAKIPGAVVNLNFVGAGVNLSADLVPVPPPMSYIYIMPDPSDLLTKYFPPGFSMVAVFTASSKPQEVVRLTLYGYVSSDNHTCVLWSLDGSLPNNVNKTCGMEVERVCKVKLVDKELQYDCEGGYDWLGEQIIHDPQWLSWADKFANMNGHK